MNTTPTDPGRPVVAVETGSPSETLALGRRLAGLLRAGDVVLLVGRLGAGKTLLASGIAEGLGVEEPVTSPTFVIVRSYQGFLPVHHADVYRLGSTGEWEDLDLPSMASEGVLLIEWGDAVAAAVPADHLVVSMRIGGGERRSIELVPHGTWVGRPLQELTA